MKDFLGEKIHLDSSSKGFIEIDRSTENVNYLTFHSNSGMENLGNVKFSVGEKIHFLDNSISLAVASWLLLGMEGGNG